MKRTIIALFSAVIVSLLLATGVAADAPIYNGAIIKTNAVQNHKLSVDELITRWENVGYPDDIGGIYPGKEQEGYIIALVNPTEARKAELLDMLNKAENVDFVSVQYSYNELTTIYNEIEKEYLGKGVVAVNITITDNNVEAMVNADNVDDVSAKLYEKYGHKIAVFAVQPGLGGSTISVPLNDSNIPQKKDSSLIYFIASAAIAAVAVAGVSLKQKTRVLSTSTGDNVTVQSDEKLSKKQVLQAVKDIKIQNSSDIFESIIKDSNKKS
ncbi:hypothetical protein SDC9_70043 [bioreactor metagenome]|uniref:Uncharacterized protein n=1 Tax=bioreactor metagenome TaxID=1076179 RepID=A0A644Y5J1_9ZZZZ|nr:hypothetical protein [Oscillospiraceae bacterium]